MRKLIILFTLFMTLNSCTNDSEENQLNFLVGTWVKTEIMENDSLSQSLQYNFNIDNTFIVSRVIIDNTTTEVIGYRYRALGTYEISENILTLRKLEIYKHDDSSGLFSNINDLELSSDSDKVIITVSIDNSQRVLTFTYPPCKPYENCFGSQSFQKID